MKHQNLQASISSAESLAACKTVLASDEFAHAPRMRRLLDFLVSRAISGDTRNTSEYAIGIEVFDRNAATYSTTEDPAVRVQVGRLREKLKDYYRVVASEIEISIPLGSYMPTFRRSSAANVKADGMLMLRQIRSISEFPNGNSFAQGLHVELLHQSYIMFNNITVIRESHHNSDDHNGNETRRAANAGATHLIEGFVRADSQRIRTSVHLLDLEHNQIRWSKQFDRSNCYDIALQEELARSICLELKQFMAENDLNNFALELPISEKHHSANPTTHVDQGRRKKHPKTQSPHRKPR
jgi:TolB-like protein